MRRRRPDRCAPAAVLTRGGGAGPARLSDRTAAPQPYFTHAPDVASSSAVRAGGPGSRVEVPYGRSWTVEWAWDPQLARYVRSEPWGPHVTEDGTRVTADNVLVLRAERRMEGPGRDLPVLQVVDAGGPFTALAGGRSVQGTWTKDGVGDRFELVTDDGQVLELAPGRTWVEMPTPAAAVVIG